MASQKSENVANGPDPIAAYSAAEPPDCRAMCEVLEPSSAKGQVPKAASKVWHGSPVWFIGENPVVGYNAARRAFTFFSGTVRRSMNRT